MSQEILPINKLLVANRGEIAIRILRAASELRIRTVTVYTYEDRYSLHRYKADESYQIGEDDDPLKPYLDIEEIIALAKEKDVEAIHPGYGFLSENVQFARRCREEGVIFIGPSPEVMERLGDKVRAKAVAREANVPVIEDSKVALDNLEVVNQEAERIGFPLVVKAASGGGGRGMRIVRQAQGLEKAWQEASSEAGKAFGDDTVFLEKYIENPKHIEVQLLGDNYGNIIHLFERDCSVQRRFQKVVEVAPCMTISEETRQKLYDYALSIARNVGYSNAGTVEFLVDEDQSIYFIEVNPRIQVEHTITEEITGVDIVRSQILIARGHKLSDRQILIRSQDEVQFHGYAIQCRVTTEDPQNNFTPDYGTLIAYRSAAGFGIRLDAGNCYTGARISPFFDSMLVKVSASGRTLKGASQRLIRVLREFRIRGVKTNIEFLENVVANPTFYRGEATVNFIAQHPELFDIKPKRDSGTKILRYLADVTVNGNPDVRHRDDSVELTVPKAPAVDRLSPYPRGSRDILMETGPEGLMEWVKSQKQILFTDTTFRDAHQSLLATRVRTTDMLKVAEGFARNHSNLFSMEMWGGATFDVCMRFLQENPWERLQLLRKAIPNILFQMLIRGSNAVGYKAYPDNLIIRFIEEASENGIDVFRIFDSLNWLEAMKVSIKTVRERTKGIAEASICYTGDLLDPDNTKYTLEYYVEMAKALEGEGAHLLAIKDMAGLLRPYAAELLVEALQKNTSVPIHLHTHDTSSIQSSTYLKAIETGVDIVDVALSSVSGLTSQPNFNSLVAALKNSPRGDETDLDSLNTYSHYWEGVRKMYYPFESGLKSGTAEVYEHEIPGGQYSNLRPQAEALGLGHKFEEVKKNYSAVNRMFGNIIKVTPSSKVVGDMALYMTSNGITEQDVMEHGASISYPDSVKDFFRGNLGQPYGGFPEELQKNVLKGEEPFSDRPNQHLKPIDFKKDFEAFKLLFDDEQTILDFISYCFYPRVFKDYYDKRKKFGNLMNLPTPAFFYGLKPNEEVLVSIAPGKTIIARLNHISVANEDGERVAAFDLNGQSRDIDVRDNSIKVEEVVHLKATQENHVGAPLQGRLASVAVEEGEEVEENQLLFVIEAMKMETNITANRKGVVKKVYLKGGDMVSQDDLVLELD